LHEIWYTDKYCTHEDHSRQEISVLGKVQDDGDLDKVWQACAD